MIEILPVSGVGEVRDGDDLAAIVAAHADLRDGDVVVVSQKIVSKAEGALRPVPEDAPAHEARRRVAREEGVRVVAETADVLILETAHGFVCANAGVDASNVDAGWLSLLPADPDASALRLREGLAAAVGVDVAVIVADTFGRPWRTGQTDVAIGVSGLAPLRDERGGSDRQGRVLDVTEVAVADELAAAADLARRKADGVPIVVVRGFGYQRDEGAGARDLVRPRDEDLFAWGRGGLSAALAGPTVPGESGVTPDDQARLGAVAAAAGAAVRWQDARHVGISAGTPGVAGLAAGLLVAAAVDLGYGAAAEVLAAGTVEVEIGR